MTNTVTTKRRKRSPPKSMSPQATQVLAYLKSGKGLSNLIALNTLGIGSLSSRIAELKAMGHDITSGSRVAPAPSNRRFTVYYLTKHKDKHAQL